MMRGVVVTLVAVAAVASIASDVCAQSVRTQVQNDSATSLDTSLGGVQSRSIEKDFPKATYRPPISSLRSSSNQKSGADALTGLLGDVGKRLEFGGVNDASRTPRSDRGTLPQDVGNGEYEGGVKVRYRLNDK